MQAGRTFLIICRMIKIEHSIFALPFAYAGALLAAKGWPDLSVIVLLTIAMVGIRSFAMGINRIVDLPYDTVNPRTQGRPLVTGEITPWQTWYFCGVSAVVFVVACAAINPVCLALSPVALVLAAFYSYTKRFTWACHFILGSVLAMAPVAGWLSVSPSFAVEPLLLACAVLYWVSGFDVIYSAQDIVFDQDHGLRSLPVRFGLPTALVVSAFCHANTVLFLFLTGLACRLSWGWYAALAVTAAVLWWEHRVADEATPERLRFAFALNGPVSVLLLVGAMLGVLM